MEKLKLSEDAKKTLEEINKEVDILMKPLDDLLKPYGYTAEDVILANGELPYVRDKKTNKKIYLF